MCSSVTTSSAQPTIVTSSLSFAMKETSNIYLKSDKNFQKQKHYHLFAKFSWDSFTFQKTDFSIETSNLPTFLLETKQSRLLTLDSPKEQAPILNKASMLALPSIWVQKLFNQICTQQKMTSGQSELSFTRCCMAKHLGHALARGSWSKRSIEIVYLSWKGYQMILRTLLGSVSLLMKRNVPISKILLAILWRIDSLLKADHFCWEKSPVSMKIKNSHLFQLKILAWTSLKYSITETILT